MAQVGTFMKCWFLMEIRIFGNYRGAALYLLLHFNNGEWYFVSFFFLLLLKCTQADSILAGIPVSWDPLLIAENVSVALLNHTQSFCSPNQREQRWKRDDPALWLHALGWQIPDSNSSAGTFPLPMPSPLSEAVWSVFMPQGAIFRVKRWRYVRSYCFLPPNFLYWSNPPSKTTRAHRNMND